MNTKPFWREPHFWAAIGLGALSAGLPFLPRWLQVLLAPVAGGGGVKTILSALSKPATVLTVKGEGDGGQ